MLSSAVYVLVASELVFGRVEVALSEGFPLTDETPAEKKKRGFLELVAAGELRTRKEKDVVDPMDLPRWVKVAVARHDILGMTWKEAMDKSPRSLSTLNNYMKASACKTWRAAIQKIADDPLKLAQFLLRDSLTETSMDYLAVLDAARDIGDYKEMRLAAKDLLKTHELLKDERSNKDAGSPIVVQVNLGNMDPEIPTVKVEHIEVIEAEVEEVDEDE